MDVYQLDEAAVRKVGEKVALNLHPGTRGRQMLKLQIDSSVSHEIGPKEVLESLRKCDALEDGQTLRIRGNEYKVSRVGRKAREFVLGSRPEECFDPEHNFLGTFRVSKRSPPGSPH